MYIRTTAAITINEDWMKAPLCVPAGEFASVDDAVGEAAIQQGAAVAATLEEARSACPSYKPLEDVEAMLSFEKGEGAKVEPLPWTPLPGKDPQPWTPPAEAVAAVAEHKGKKQKKSNQ